MHAIYGIHSAIYMALFKIDYVIQENVRSSSGSTSQRKNQATPKVFLYTTKSINIMTKFSCFRGVPLRP